MRRSATQSNRTATSGRHQWEGVPEERRVIMRANRRRDTKPELAVRSLLHRSGLRFRVDYPIRVPGHRPIRPDVVFTRRKVAIFIDGCFWHGCPEHGTRSTTNAAYWDRKLSENKARDARHTAELEAAGWQVYRFWEHEDPQSILAVVRSAIE